MALAAILTLSLVFAAMVLALPHHLEGTLLHTAKMRLAPLAFVRIGRRELGPAGAPARLAISDEDIGVLGIPAVRVRVAPDGQSASAVVYGPKDERRHRALGTIRVDLGSTSGRAVLGAKILPANLLWPIVLGTWLIGLPWMAERHAPAGAYIASVLLGVAIVIAIWQLVWWWRHGARLRVASERVLAHLAGQLPQDRTESLVPLLAELAQRGRDEAWDARFERALEQASLERGARGVFTGPDGFRYLDLVTTASRAGSSITFGEAAAAGIADCHGITVDATDEGAAYVLSLGRLVDYVFTGHLAVGGLVGSEHRVLTEKESVLIAQPSPALLPPTVRAGLRAWLQQRLGVERVGIALMDNPRDRPSRSLLLRTEGLTPEVEQRVMRAASWFFPSCAPAAKISTGGIDYAPL